MHYSRVCMLAYLLLLSLCIQTAKFYLHLTFMTSTFGMTFFLVLDPADMLSAENFHFSTAYIFRSKHGTGQCKSRNFSVYNTTYVILMTHIIVLNYRKNKAGVLDIRCSSWKELMNLLHDILLYASLPCKAAKQHITVLKISRILVVIRSTYERRSLEAAYGIHRWKHRLFHPQGCLHKVWLRFLDWSRNIWSSFIHFYLLMIF
jgi:hypothetical protein